MNKTTINICMQLTSYIRTYFWIKRVFPLSQFLMSADILITYTPHILGGLQFVYKGQWQWVKWETGIAMATKPGEGKVAEREESRHSMKQCENWRPRRQTWPTDGFCLACLLCLFFFFFYKRVTCQLIKIRKFHRKIENWDFYWKKNWRICQLEVLFQQDISWPIWEAAVSS